MGEAIEQDFHSDLKKCWQTLWWLRVGEWHLCPQWGWGAVTLTECIARLWNTLRMSLIPPAHFPWTKQNTWRVLLHQLGNSFLNEGGQRVCSNSREITPWVSRERFTPGCRRGESVRARELLVEPLIEEEQCCFCPGWGKLVEIYNPGRMLEGTWEFAQPVYTCLVDLPCNHIPQGALWGAPLRIWGRRPLIRHFTLCTVRGRARFDWFGLDSTWAALCYPLCSSFFWDRFSRGSLQTESIK